MQIRVLEVDDDALDRISGVITRLCLITISTEGFPQEKSARRTASRGQ